MFLLKVSNGEQKCAIVDFFIQCIFNNLDAYIFGGYNGNDIFGDLWRLDLDTLAWKKLPNDMAEPAYFHGTTTTPVSLCLPYLIYLHHYFVLYRS